MFLHYTVYSWDKTKCRKSKRNILRNLFVRLNLIFSKGYFTERKCWAKYFKATLQYVRFSDVFITDVFGLANIFFLSSSCECVNQLWNVCEHDSCLYMTTIYLLKETYDGGLSSTFLSLYTSFLISFKSSMNNEKALKQIITQFSNNFSGNGNWICFFWNLDQHYNKKNHQFQDK